MRYQAPGIRGKISRREALRLGAGFAAATVFNKIGFADAPALTKAVKTTNGPVQGLVENGVQTFKGLRYAAPPLGPLRFMPPQKPKPWTELAEATKLGAASMQLRTGGSAVSYPGHVGQALGQLYTPPDDIARQNEDCMFLNVWTPQLGSSRKRPVMFWIHGGGFNYGSGSWPAYDGHNLASRHDVVVVTVNHRLNAFGYLYLGDLGGDAYATSGNAGQLDLIAALGWVRDNIAEFGGDAGNVTVFGQSGGGGKISALLAMPGAKGLFHRAIIESGPGIRGTPKEIATGVAKVVLSELGISSGDIKALQAAPADNLAKAAAAMQARLGGGTGMGTLRFAPVVDGIALPNHPFDPVAPAISASVPIMIGCTKDEQTLYNVGQPWWGKLTDAELVEKARTIPAVGDKAEALIAAFRKLRPGDSPSYLYTDVASSTFAFANSIRLAERKAALKAAPAYFYVFQWGAPVDGGILRAPHTMEIPFAFDNVDKGPLLLGNDPQMQALAKVVSGTWVEFARTGNPNHSGLPHWPAYDAQKRATMTFNTPCKVVNDLEVEVRKILEA
ncbi:MAG TPA: carboxylesterase/lipase family protein [Candidatus Angelobacter sp.]